MTGNRLAGLRVLAFCDHFSLQPGGGAERAALEVYRRLAAQGAQITVLTATPRPVPTAFGGIRLERVELRDLSGVMGAEVGIAPDLFRRGQALCAASRPTVLHANTLFFQSSLAAAWVQYRTGVPLVTTIQIAGLEHLPLPTRIAAQVYEMSLGRFVLSRSSRVIAVSSSVRDHLLRLGIGSGRIDMAPNGVELNNFAIERRNIDPGRPPHIIFVGRLIENKGPRFLLDALAHLASERFSFSASFVGDGPLGKNLRRKAAKLGLQDRVSFTGHLDEVASELAKADIFVRPSLTEGLPLAVLEAMAARVCVVASDIPGNRDLIRNEANGLLVTPYDSKSLTGALRRLLRSPSEARWLAEAGYETARSYSWENTARQTGESLLTAALLTPTEDKRAA